MPARHLLQPKTLDDMLLYVMWQLQACAGSVVVRLCESEFGITRREWRMVAQLAVHEGVQSSELARHAALDRARTSRALTGLEAKGLVERTPRPGDRREVLVRLTPQGRALHAALLPRVMQINRELLSALDEGEVEQLERFFVRLQQRAEAMRADARGAAERAP